MESSPRNLFNKVKENASSAAKKALLVTGLTLGVFGSPEVKGQEAGKPIETEQQDSTELTAAVKEYEALVAHRDSVLEYNKLIEKMNTSAQKAGDELGATVKKEKEGPTANKDALPIKIQVPNFIEQTGQTQSTGSSIASFVTGHHEVTFQGGMRGAVSEIKTEVTSWETFLKSYEFKYAPLDQKNPAVVFLKNFLKQYKNTKTGKTFENADIRLMGASSKTIYGVLPGGKNGPQPDPSQWSAQIPKTDGQALITEFMFAWVNLDNTNTAKTTIPERIGGNSSLTSLQQVKKYFTYKGIEPKSVEIKSYQSVSTDIAEPVGRDAEEGNMTERLDYWMNMSYICIPIWDKKLVPALPNKKTFIAKYAASHPRDTLQSIHEIVKDTVSYAADSTSSVSKTEKSDTATAHSETKHAEINAPNDHDALIKNSENYPRLREVYKRYINPTTGLENYIFDHYIDSEGSVIDIQ